MHHILGVSAIVLMSSQPLVADEKDPPKYAFQLKAVEAKKTDTPLAALLKERYNAAIGIALDELIRIETGQVTVTALGEAMDLLVGAGLELFTDSKDRLAVLEESVRYSQYAEKITALRFEAGTVPRNDVNKAKYIRATAEIRLLKEKEMSKR